ncbi:MAG: pseudouridine synthase [Methanoregulaceae archaeon]|nr:pseudouridine synthase [Methanoregulaceae archaeon]
MLQRARVIADYQFGKGTGIHLFPEGCEFTLSKTGRVRQILFRSKRIATIRAEDGRLTLSIEGAARLHGHLPAPVNRVVISRDVSDFVSEGKNAFARHVIQADEGIRAGDEVMIVTEGDQLIATGMAMLSGTEMLSFNYGVAVKVRQGRS